MKNRLVNRSTHHLFHFITILLCLIYQMEDVSQWCLRREAKLELSVLAFQPCRGTVEFYLVWIKQLRYYSKYYSKLLSLRSFLCTKRIWNWHFHCDLWFCISFIYTVICICMLNIKCSVHKWASVEITLQLSVGSRIAIGYVVYSWNWIPCTLKFLHKNALRLRKKMGNLLADFC